MKNVEFWWGKKRIDNITNIKRWRTDCENGDLVEKNGIDNLRETELTTLPVLNTDDQMRRNKTFFSERIDNFYIRIS